MTTHPQTDPNASSRTPESAPGAPRRASLRSQVLLGAITPFLVMAAVTLGYTAVRLPQATDTILLEGAKQLAVSVGSSLDLSDPGKENQHLMLLTQQPDVFFVQVSLPDRTSLFRAKNADDETTIKGPLEKYIEANPDGGTYLWRDTRAEAFRVTLEQLKSSGQASPDAVSGLEANIARTQASAGQVTTLKVQRVGLKDENGSRRIVPLNEANLIVSVGVIADRGIAIKDQFLTLLALAAALGLALAAVIAFLTAQRIISPIQSLVARVNAISLGEIEQPVRVERRDEVGELAEAVERMRVSLSMLLRRAKNR